MDFYLLNLLTNEFNSLLNSAVLRKIYEMDGGVYILQFYSGIQQNLLIRLKGEDRCIHFISDKKGQAKTPSSFCMLMRKYIEGRKLVSVISPQHEKRLIFVFSDGNNEWKLVAEFFGREGNLILLTGNDKVLGTYRVMPEHRISDKRDYLIPVHREEESHLPDTTAKKSQNISPCVYYQDNKPIKYSVYGEEIEGLTKIVYPTINDMLYEFYKFRKPEFDFEECKKELLNRFNKEKNKANKRIAHINGDLVKLEQSSFYSRLGELILTNMYKIEPKAVSLVAENFYEDPPVEIEITLDPSLSASDNAKKYFDKFKKSQRGIPILKERLAESILKLKLINENIDKISKTENISELDMFNELLNYQSKQVPKEQQIASAPRRYYYKGYEIISGKNPAQNDEVSLKISNKTDLWFHTRGIPGSHTIIRVQSGEKTPKEVIVYAASVAAYYSKAKKSSKVPVSYTYAKNVSKKKGMPPGMVTIHNETTIVVNPQNYDFLEWLKQQEQQEGA